MTTNHCRSRETVAARVAARTARYADLPLFRAFATDAIPIERFPHFFKEQAMAARWFQDLIWATTEIAEGPYASFAREHRRKDSGHFRWMQKDLATAGLAPMTPDDYFALESLPTRMHMARVLGALCDAAPATKMVVLASLESAGAVTLGTLFGYVQRHGLADRLLYLGATHVRIEQGQVDELARVAAGLLASTDADHLAAVDLVFDALTTMFDRGGERYYGDLLGRAPRDGAAAPEA
jgi:hypothetical protein